ncbi:MAG: flagellum-specific ATP synthase FliI, partial [Zoogloea sp.]|nr:flagellum-specific ATP synthase FliI [Zoogloea sp.]
MDHGTPTWKAFLEDARKMAAASSPYQVAGRLTRINGLVMEASGLKLAVGAGCRIAVPGGSSVEAEVVGFHGDKIFLMPTDDVFGLAPGAQVLPIEPAQPSLVAGERIEPRRRASDRAKHLPMGDELLGRVVDGAGRPLDGLGPLTVRHSRPLQSRPINPLQRAPINQSLDVGIRAINGLLTIGRGQRMGLFAGSGVGKSVLTGMLARFTAADVIVVGLIGERGREVKEFIEHNLGAEGLARSAVIA